MSCAIVRARTSSVAAWMPDAFEDRATVLEAPRVLPFGDRVGRFCVIRGEEPPPADESDDGDDVA